MNGDIYRLSTTLPTLIFPLFLLILILSRTQRTTPEDTSTVRHQWFQIHAHQD